MQLIKRLVLVQPNKKEHLSQGRHQLHQETSCGSVDHAVLLPAKPQAAKAC